MPNPLLLLALAAAVGQAPVDPQQFEADIRMLASDEFEGRGPASRGESKALSYIATRFRSAGLEPGGAGGGWYQPVAARKSVVTSTPSAVWTRAGSRMPLRYGEDFIAYSRGPGGQLALAEAPLVFVGYSIDAPERGWDDFKGADLKGKIAVVLVNEPDLADPRGPFDGKALTAHGMARAKLDAAARHGALGALLIHDENALGWGWQVAQTSYTQPQFSLEGESGSEAGLQVEGWLSADAASRLVHARGLDLAQLAALARRADFRPVDLDGRLSITFSYRTVNVPSYNVLGILKGVERPCEYLFYVAHWDHLGRADGRPGDSIYNGAMDNATGVAAIIAAARALAKGPRPRRSIVFMATTLEEKGLLGARWYAAHPIYPLVRTVAAINIDSLMPFPPARDLTVVGLGKSGLDAWFERAAALKGRRLTADPNPEIGAYYRSDHYAFAEVGIPSAFVASGSDLIDGGESMAAQLGEIVARRYHQPFDEVDEGFRFDGMIPDVQIFTDVGRDLANSTEWPEWSRGSEFTRPNGSYQGGQKTW